MTDVVVGIVSWNTAEHLDRCLGALPAALDGLDTHVVVVDNASSDESAAAARRHGGVTVIENTENRGYAAAMNQALGSHEAPFRIAINPDTVPGPESLRELVSALRDDERIAVAVPKLVNPDGSLQHSVHRFPTIMSAAVINLLPRAIQAWRPVASRFWPEGLADHDRATDIDWAIGAVHCMRSSAVGDWPYRERWHMYVEDLDLCWRMRQRGWRVRLVPGAVVAHVGNAAGSQRWGDDRTRVWLTATLDWLRLEQGSRRARVHASISILGLLPRLLLARVRSRPIDRYYVRVFGTSLALHLRALARPVDLDGHPAGASPSRHERSSTSSRPSTTTRPPRSAKP